MPLTGRTDSATLILWTLVIYLYGAVPFAYLAIYLLKRQHITEEGTGNVSVINAFHVGGIPATLVAVVGEISKSVIAIRLAEHVFPGQFYVKLVFVLAAFVGANFSVFLGGRGGRGSTLLFWSVAQLSIPVFLVLIAISGLLLALSRKDVRLKRMWPWFIPGVILLVERDWRFGLFGLLVSLLVLVKGRRSRDDYLYYGYVRRNR